MRVPSFFAAVTVAALATSSVYAPATAATLSVCKSGCTYSTIQSGIDATNYLDTVIVGGGVYTERIAFHGKVITVQSSGGAAETIIDGGAGGSVVTFDGGCTADTVFEGFTVKNGNATDGGGISSASGSSPTIRNCIITGNAATGHGGGIFAWSASITGCTVSGNTILHDDDVGGGGIWMAAGTLSDSTISGNRVTLSSAGSNREAYGGGVAARPGVIVSNCLVADNSVTASMASADSTYSVSASGGGISGGTVSNCVVSGNTVQATPARGAANASGGGIYATSSVADCTVVGNSALKLPGTQNGEGVGQGGGIFVGTYGSASYGSATNSLIASNIASHEGGGVAGGPVTNCTISGNSAFNDSGDATCGGGVSGSTSNSTISNNTATYGGGTCGGNHTDSTIVGNLATNGGGSYQGSATRCAIIGNTASGNGGGTFAMAALYSSTISGNKAVGYGGGVYASLNANAVISFTTISGNYAGSRGGGLVVPDYATTAVNSVVWGNGDAEAVTTFDDICVSGGTFSVTYSDIKGGWQGTGNFNLDPLFVEPAGSLAAPTAAGDYHLRSGSPCVDQASTPHLASDIDGDDRPLGPGYDVGADEYSTETKVTIRATAGSASESGPTPGEFTISRTGSTVASLTVDFTVTGTATPDTDYTSIGASATIPAGASSETITVLPVNDLDVEVLETVVATLDASPGYTVGNSASATITIADNDALHKAVFESLAAYDGWILESAENSGRGGTKSATETVIRVGDDAANNQYRSILSFDTAALPVNATLVTATLRLRSVGRVGANPFGTHGKLLVDIRKGAFSGKPLLEAADFQAAASRSGSISVGKLPVAKWYSAELDPTSLRSINRLGPTQFRLRFTRDDNNDRGADYLRLSSGNATTGMRPALDVLYRLP